jgi:DNA-binding NarL/FixJ family response regulator
MRTLRRDCHPERMSLRCLIVDDDAGFGAAARRLLDRQGLVVVGVAASCAEAMRRVRELAPDVALVDVGLGEESGFDLARDLNDLECPSLGLILISTREESDFDSLIEASPAVGFLSKSQLSAQAIFDLLRNGHGSASV